MDNYYFISETMEDTPFSKVKQEDLSRSQIQTGQIDSNNNSHNALQMNEQYVNQFENQLTEFKNLQHNCQAKLLLIPLLQDRSACSKQLIFTKIGSLYLTYTMLQIRENQTKLVEPFFYQSPRASITRLCSTGYY